MPTVGSDGAPLADRPPGDKVAIGRATKTHVPFFLLASFLPFLPQEKIFLRTGKIVRKILHVASLATKFRNGKTF